METYNAVEIAKKIIELDVKRDELLEDLMNLAGNRAFELLRFMQNKK
ncbi:hypothetical protein ACFFIX_13750 [Metabacillus herbersteinensis]|uniref:Uncharacterized protein n=1 Tax=Metabacillus herbersteinensis TaxID=283816 RepID=A0ABV6GG46_9BACI